MFCGNSFVPWSWVIMACTLNIKFLQYKLVLTWKGSTVTDSSQVLIVKRKRFRLKFFTSQLNLSF